MPDDATGRIPGPTPHRARGLTVFLALALGPPWLIWELSMARGWTPGDETFPLAVLAAAFCPAMATVVVRAWVTREGFADAGLSLRLGSPTARRWYLAAWLWPLPVALAVLALAWLTGPAEPDWTLRMGSADPQGSIPAALAVGLGGNLALAAPAAVVVFGEEFGWRGWLQGRLLPGHPLADAALTGVIWSAWHAPLILRGFDYPQYPVAGMAVFTVVAVLVSIILGRIRQESGSVWATCLGHGAVNAVGMGVTGLAFAPDTPEVWVSFVGLLALPGLAVAAWWFGRGLRPRPGREDGNQ